MDIPYKGRFSAEQLEPIMAAAAPIPVGEVEWRDDVSGQVRVVPRAEAIVRRLEWLDIVTQRNLHQQDDIAASELEKRFRRIATAADALIGSLGQIDTPMPRQVHDALRWLAEKHAERIGGLPHHPPTTWRIDGEEFKDFHGDDQLRDDIEGVQRIRDWAREAERLARSRVNKHDDALRVAELAGVEPQATDPITDALSGILQLWIEVLGREIRTAVHWDSGKAYGPLLAFVLACLHALQLKTGRGGASLTEEAIRARILRLQAMYEARPRKSTLGH